MQVSAWTNGNGTFGVRIGAANREKFFSPHWKEIHVEIEGETHAIPICGGFWRHCPEVRSPAIRAWLKQHHTLRWAKGDPPRAELIPVGEARFRLASR